MEDGKSTRYVRCLQCNTVYASPRAPIALRHAVMDATFGVGERASRNAMRRRPALLLEAELIKRYVPAGQMLDIGCDLGDFFEAFPDPNWQRFGVELSPSAAAYAAETYSATVFAGTLQQASFSGDSFELVTMIDLIYLLDDVRGDLLEVHRLLAPGGVFAIEVTGQFYQLSRSRGMLCWLLERRWTRLHTDSAYLVWPTPTAIDSLLKETGFHIEGWHVVPSPEQLSTARKVLSQSYYFASAALADLSISMLTLAPKYLCIARKT